MDSWTKDVERIQQATGLPIVCLRIPKQEAAAIQSERERDGWELVSDVQENGLVSLVLIESSHWHSSARSLLDLFFSRPDPKSTLPEQVASWLRGVMEGAFPAPPPRLEQQWPWRESRVCFLLERCRLDSSFEWNALQPLLQDFYEEATPTLTFIPMGHIYLLLAVPHSMLGNQNEPEELLEWASGLHDLISTELMESVRIIVGVPIDTPLSLGTSLTQSLAISSAIQQYRPRVMVAGSWLYPLERWAATLSEETSLAVSRGIQSMMPVPRLSAEQIETLETLFARQLNVSDTARQLFLHRNTLLYRLDKLTEQTGLDPRLFPDAVLLQLFLLFRHN